MKYLCLVYGEESDMETVSDADCIAYSEEQLAGFYLIDAADMDEATQVASGIPPARIGSIEVRPVRVLQP